MKYFGAILVVLATAFINQNEASPSTSLDRLQQNVNNTVRFLVAYKTDLAENGDAKFDGALTKETAKIAKAANQTLQEIEDAVEEANNDGRDAQDCYESAESDISASQDRVVAVLEKCFEDNKPDWEPAQNTTDDLIIHGENIIDGIDDIRVECANSTHQEVCVALKLPGVGVAVGLYRAAVGQLKRQVGLITADGFKAIARCSGLSIITYRVELKNARHNAQECIDSTQVTTPESTTVS